MRKHGSMQVTVHYPESPEAQQALRELAARIHADTVCRVIQELPCSHGEKLRLLDAIIDASVIG